MSDQDGLAHIMSASSLNLHKNKSRSGNTPQNAKLFDKKEKLDDIEDQGITPKSAQIVNDQSRLSSVNKFEQNNTKK